ncbi:MAG: hypothetical protein EGQ02_21700, partial [Enterobacter cloacae]|nr:hypothetical protein [Enterobacter cloacae]
MFDIGLNLTSSQFAKDRDDVVARAFAAGVKGLLLTGTNLHESEQAQQLAQRYDRCWSTAGVHPHDSSQWTSESAQIIHRLAKTAEVVAIGGCGLDFNRNFSTPAEQEKEHAKKFFKYLEGGMVEITASYPAGIISTTAENLKAAADGENEEWADLYPEFAQI